MRGLIGIVGLTLLVAACAGPVPVALNAPPPTPYPAPYQYPPPPPQYPVPAPAPAMVQAPIAQPPCTQEQAAETVQTQRTLDATNGPCVLYWRSLEVRQHPERAFLLECNGLKAYPDPQPPGHPASIAECDRNIRDGQAKMGIPVRGMSEEQKVTYRATWGGG